jgi:hypothetical protein
MKTIVAKVKFCGYEEYNMNQWFRLKDEYPLEKVESIQIEIRKNGFREEENYKQTAELLNAVLSKLLGLPEKDKSPAVVEEDKPDEALIEKAYQKVTGIVGKELHKAMLKVGKYLIKEFYGDDIKRVRQKNPVKKHSLHQLILRLHNSTDNAPSKTWIYNARDLATDERQFEKVSVYGKLGHSHKVYLTYVSDLKVKEKLIKETAKNKYTVAKLRERIAELKGKKEPVLSLDEIPTLPYLRSLDVNILKRNEQKAKDAHEFHRKRAEHFQKVQQRISTALNDVKASTKQNS